MSSRSMKHLVGWFCAGVLISVVGGVVYDLAKRAWYDRMNAEPSTAATERQKQPVA